LLLSITNSSIGEGIIKLKRHKGGKWLLYWKKGSPKLLSNKKVVATINKYVRKQKYMIQEATYNVTVQRGGSGSWQNIEMIGRDAGIRRHVTNVAKGGKVREVEELFTASGFNPEEIKSEMRQVSLSIMNYLSFLIWLMSVRCAVLLYIYRMLNTVVTIIEI
jgi:hypothetical protein